MMPSMMALPSASPSCWVMPLFLLIVFMLSRDKPVADVDRDPRWEWVGKFVVFLFVRNPFHWTKISE